MSSARIRVGAEIVAEIGVGLCALVAVAQGDRPAAAERMAAKLAGLRLFADDNGVMNHSMGEVGGGLLVVSQFTLYGDTSRGRRPSWAAAAPAAFAEGLLDDVVAKLRRTGLPVATGRFGALMAVELVNEGPVTVIVET